MPRKKPKEPVGASETPPAVPEPPPTADLQALVRASMTEEEWKSLREGYISRLRTMLYTALNSLEATLTSFDPKARLEAIKMVGEWSGFHGRGPSDGAEGVNPVSRSTLVALVGAFQGLGERAQAPPRVVSGLSVVRERLSTSSGASTGLSSDLLSVMEDEYEIR